ncbi:MAG TPA: SIMPL domain-containing protein [Sphingobium sp.]|nr:SIMPL domain-containing protein [Sphingobium sp.]
MVRLFALSLALATTPLLGASPALAQATPMMIPATGPVISLSVTEDVESTPDMATVGTGVQTRALSAREAMRLNAQAMDRLIAAILKSGIARKDIQTSGISLSPQYDYSNRAGSQGPRFIGYEASNQLTVKLREITTVGDIIDAMVTAGATNINGPSFGIADPAPLLQQAREKAIRSGNARAQFYAAQTGHRSARLVSISETGQFGPPVPMPMMRAQAAEAASTKVEPGQLSTSVTLSFQYVLEK